MSRRTVPWIGVLIAALIAVEPLTALARGGGGRGGGFRGGGVRAGGGSFRGGGGSSFGGGNFGGVSARSGSFSSGGVRSSNFQDAQRNIGTAGARSGSASSFNRSSVSTAGVRAGSTNIAGTNRAALSTGVRAPWAGGATAGARATNVHAASFHGGQWNNWMGASHFSQAAHHHGWGFHNNAWVNHSHWHNHYPNHWHHGWWGWWRPIGYWPGWRLWAGYGYGGYGYGGYGYYNPYYTQSVYGPLYYDYSQPLPATPTDSDTVTDPNAQSAMGQFTSAQAQFKRGDAAGALENVDVAIRSAPSDTRLHEFRALALFSLGRYNEAAETLYPVLAAGPGWDWDTVWSLYPSYDAYTRDLRTLEAHVKAHPDAAAPRFLAAYHHLVLGHMKSANRDLSEVVSLQPQDKLAQALLDALNQQGAGATSAPPNPDGPPGITAPRPKTEPTPSRSANALPMPPQPKVD